MNLFLIRIINLLAIILLSPFFIGLIRKIKAKFQNRKGASLFQPYRDLWKLFHKDEVVSEDASWIFLFAPYVVFATSIVLSISIPVFSYNSYGLSSDLLVFVYVVALGTFFVALAGLDTGGAFGGFGSSREMLVASLTEAGLILSLFVLAVISGTTDIFLISKSISNLSFLEFLPVLVAFAGFYIAFLAETCRYPFDNPATHLELTMIHEAMILEYSGKRLALIEWASFNKYLLFATVGVNLFFPWGLSFSFGLYDLVIAFIIFVFKISLLSFSVAYVESTIAKLRLFKLPRLLLTSYVLSVVAIILIL